MTETEWLTCADPEKMLEFLRGKASDRKLTLFCCACCRHLWHLLEDSRSRRSTEAAEQRADGLIARAEMEAAWQDAEEGLHNVCRDHRKVSIELISRIRAADVGFRVGEALIRAKEATFDLNYHAGQVAVTASDAIAYFAVKDVAHIVDPPLNMLEETEVFDHRDGMGEPDEDREHYRLSDSDRILVNKKDTQVIRSSWMVESESQCSLLREIVGNPFRPVTVSPTSQTANVVSLAQAIYDERAFDRLPILADALEESGCTNPDILNHCRQPGEHVRGCWVVDLLLAKE